MTNFNDFRIENRSLDVALDVATSAASLANNCDDADSQLKSVHELVTKADVAVERHIKDQISAQFPTDAFVGEEEGADGDSRRVWYVDPIDGTTDFVFDLSHWAISIALVVDGHREVGVVSHPAAETTYAAIRGEGAFRNGDPITVSSASDPARSLFGIGFSHRDVGDKQMRMVLDGLLDETLGVRRYGAAALTLCYVADGTLNGFVHRNLDPIDVAAATLIVEEAGGVVRDFDGRSGDAAAMTGDLVATTEVLADVLSFVA